VGKKNSHDIQPENPNLNVKGIHLKGENVCPREGSKFAILG